jgi:phosphohistidine phosphatase
MTGDRTGAAQAADKEPIMNLYFMRHGIAVDRTSGQRSDDRHRQLTPKGIKRINKAANGLVRLSISFNRILTSPFERARQTAKVVAQTLHSEDRLEEIPQLCPDQSVEDLLSGLSAYAADKEILLVGHEPLLSRTMAFLLSATDGAEIRLKKGGLCCLEIDGMPAKKPAVLQWALTPKQLRLLAR